MANRSFIQRTITKQYTWVPLTVEPLERTHLDFWHTQIQPVIRELGPSQRVDYDWNWYTITSVARTPITFRQQPAAYALIYSHPTGTSIVCGLIQLVRKYVYLPDKEFVSAPRPAGFLWKCSTAPTHALTPYFPHGDMPKRLAQLCIDTAVTVSEQDGYEGRICLHADPGSAPPHMPQDILFKFYRDPPIRMNRLSPTIKIPRLRGLFAPNDGRYFYFDKGGADLYSQLFTDYRKPI